MTDATRITNVFAPGGQFDQALSAKKADARAGLFLGQRALYSPYAASYIEEVAEEAGFFAAEKFEKELAKRKSKELRKGQINMSQMAEEFCDLAKNLKSPEVLLKFMDLLKKMNNATSDAILKELARLLEDVSDQFTALSFAEEVLEGEDQAEDLLQQVRDAKEKLMKDAGPAVRAGLNITREAINAAKEGVGEFQQLRDFYRDIILSHEGVKDSFNAIRKEYGEGGLEKAIAYLIKAAGSDLSAQGPSMEAAQLKAIIDNLYQVESLSGINKRIQELLARIVSNFGVQLRGGSETVMDTILTLAEAYRVKSEEFLKLSEQLGLKELLQKIYFLTGLNEQIRLIPFKLYEDPESREKLLDASQEALDEVIYEEEEQEEGGYDDEEDEEDEDS